MDTNVAVVANGRAPQARDGCVETCISRLLAMRNHHRVLLDERGLILDEYRQHLSPSGQPGPGDAFFKWLWYNQANPEHCRQVPVTPIDDAHRSFEEFPDDPDLTGFDRNDRKFVAVALGSGEQAPILNATDRDWWEHRAALLRHGVQIQFLCPELMPR
jgi:hypothetical protein